jgi:hypothetical protein
MRRLDLLASMVSGSHKSAVHFGRHRQGGVEKSPASLDRFLRGTLHGIKLASTNPDMAKKAISRNPRLTDPKRSKSLSRNVAISRSLYSTK